MTTMIDQLGVLTSCREVVERSRYVAVDEAAIAGLAPGLARRVTPPPWHQKYHRISDDERTVTWLLVLDALNFSFWGEPRWRVEAGGERLDGYFALAASLSRALDEGVPITDARYLSTIGADDLAHILRGENSIPMLDRRAENLREVGEALNERFDGQFARAVESCGGSAVRLVRLVAQNFPSFDDVADHVGSGIRVETRFYKRAQLLVSDLYGAFKGERWGRFDDLDRLTAFADYKLPKVLRHMGILTYLPSLAEKVDHRFVFPPSSREEVEIRAATVWAVELLRQALERHGNPTRAFELDWWLWRESQTLTGMRPYHLVRTVYY